VRISLAGSTPWKPSPRRRLLPPVSTARASERFQHSEHRNPEPYRVDIRAGAARTLVELAADGGLLPGSKHLNFAPHFPDGRRSVGSTAGNSCCETVDSNLHLGQFFRTTFISIHRRTTPLGHRWLKHFGLTPVPRLSARFPIFFNVVSRARISFGLASAKTFLISAACLR